MSRASITPGTRIIQITICCLKIELDAASDLHVICHTYNCSITLSTKVRFSSLDGFPILER